MIFDYFDGAYFINLSERKDRREAFERRSTEAGFTAERFSAICPPPVPASKTTDAREHYKIGCAMSHRGCIALAQERNQQRVLIFEDDCVFVPNFSTEFPKYVEELKTVEEWDVCFLGGSPEPDYANLGAVCQQIAPNLYFNPGAVWGAHAYAINARFYAKMLNQSTFPQDIAFISFKPRTYLMTAELLTWQDEESVSDLWGGTWARKEEYLKNYRKCIR